jgi:hypothetical protein
MSETFIFPAATGFNVANFVLTVSTIMTSHILILFYLEALLAAQNILPTALKVRVRKWTVLGRELSWLI